MARLQKHFEVSIPKSRNTLLGKKEHIADVIVCGVGYCFTNEDPKDQFDYDIDQIIINGKEILPEALECFGIEPKEEDWIDEAVMARIIKMFKGDGYDEIVETIEAREESVVPVSLFPTLASILNPNQKRA